MNKLERQAYIQALLLKAKEASEDAVFLITRERANAAMNRAYYSMFFGARACLVCFETGEFKASGKKHSNII
ncbi:HEPN domain-containing protein, partial [Arthrospira platensis SPKY1]|nr:HEPN domain-containing protein [Arthrospira platensis SPKY1]